MIIHKIHSDSTSVTQGLPRDSRTAVLRTRKEVGLSFPLRTVHSRRQEQRKCHENGPRKPGSIRDLCVVLWYRFTLSSPWYDPPNSNLPRRVTQSKQCPIQTPYGSSPVRDAELPNPASSLPKDRISPRGICSSILGCSMSAIRTAPPLA